VRQSSGTDDRQVLGLDLRCRTAVVLDVDSVFGGQADARCVWLRVGGGGGGGFPPQTHFGVVVDLCEVAQVHFEL